MSTTLPSRVIGAITTADLRRTVVQDRGVARLGVRKFSRTTATCPSSNSIVVLSKCQPFTAAN